MHDNEDTVVLEGKGELEEWHPHNPRWAPDVTLHDEVRRVTGLMD